MLRDNMYGIDLGTSTIKIYDAKKDTFSKEKNMVAVRNGDTLFAVEMKPMKCLKKRRPTSRSQRPCPTGGSET